MNRGLLFAALLGLLVGCESAKHPSRALPESFEVKTLSGQTLGPKELRGTPWVVNLWVPG